MKISIITVCYNSGQTVRDTIESVLSQSYSNIEYIVVDGASKDNTIDIVNEYKDHITKIISEPDKGIYDAMNKGVKLASGDVVGILNSDDFYESKDAIAEIARVFNESNSVDMVFGDVVFVDPLNLQIITRYYSSEKFLPWKLRFGWMPPHPATFIRKDAYDKYGYYQLNYKIAADYEIFVRFLMVYKLTFKRINKVIVRMRAGGASTAGIKSSIILNKEIVRACLENKIYTNIFLVLIKLPFKLLDLVKKPKNHDE